MRTQTKGVCGRPRDWYTPRVTEDDQADPDPEAAVEIPIDGVLDLHWFSPRDIRTLVPDYIDECEKRGIYALRFIHGKGTGALRKGVHALLTRNPKVKSFKLAGMDGGGWGATVVDLHEPSED